MDLYEIFGKSERYPDGWPVPRTSHTVIFCAAVLLFWVYLATDADGFAGVLDYVNLLIHEAGHLVFLPFGRTMHFWGGTLLQCIFPALCFFSFWKTKQPAGAAFSGIWFGQNLLNVARYMADAEEMALPLLGGGIHDWNTIFGDLGLLKYSRIIAGLVWTAGWLTMIAAAAWYVGRWLRCRKARKRAAKLARLQSRSGRALDEF